MMRTRPTLTRFALAGAFSLLLFATPSAPAQELSKQTKVGESDLERVISAYAGSDARARLLEIRREMPFNRPDTRYRDFQRKTLESLPPEYATLRVSDAALEEAVRQLFMPVLKLYNREDAYAYVVLEHQTPLFEVNSDVAMILTTGWLRQLQSDDEALGFIAHDIAHRLFEREMAEASRTRENLENSPGGELLQRRQILTMAQIELSCDAVSAVTLAAEGYDANAYAGALERIARDFSSVPVHGHPDVAQRVKLIARLSAPATRRVSQNLLNVRKLFPTDKLAKKGASRQ